MSADPYEVLGVTRNASTAEVRKAHKRAAMRAHPDRQGGSLARAALSPNPAPAAEPEKPT